MQRDFTKQIYKALNNDLRGINSVLQHKTPSIDVSHFSNNIFYGEEKGVGYQTIDGIKLEEFHSQESPNMFFEIQRGYVFSKEEDITCSFYRYALFWYYDVETLAVKDQYVSDYYSEGFITLKRSIRFDYHPYCVSPTDKILGENTEECIPHWHPNGCTDLKIETKMMLEPCDAIAFFSYFFARDSIFNSLSSDKKNVVLQLLGQNNASLKTLS